jgi:hypothetical protein
MEPKGKKNKKELDPKRKTNKDVEFNPAEHEESDPPTGEDQFSNEQKFIGSPSNYEGIPPGLQDMSELGAIATWIRQNCKFAKV